jgi:hypothetical protein
MLTRSAEATQRDRNAQRFRWHEALIADPQLTAAALRFAAMIMHRYRWDSGWAAVSHRSAARKLKMSERSMLRARDLLIKRGWLYRSPCAVVKGGVNPTARYGLGGGPDDLDFRVGADGADMGDST